MLRFGPYTIIEPGVSVGDDSIIYGQCYIGAKTIIGLKNIIFPQVVIRENSQLGANVIVHSGTVIAADGFGYEKNNGVHEKIPQLGTVLIEDDVEIGSNVTIDRARLNKTIIGRGTKIDNLVQIGHNVKIGEQCIIISQVGIAGSTIVGNNAILAGQAGVAGHLTIGENVIVGAQAGVTKSIPANLKVSGYPAREHKEAAKLNAHTKKLPEYAQTIKDLQSKVKQLEDRINNE